MTKTFLTTIAAFLALPVIGFTQIISINIGYNGSTNFLEPAQTAGVVAADNWNNLSFSQGTLGYSNSGTPNGSPTPNDKYYFNNAALVDDSGNTTSIGFEMVGGTISDSHFDDATFNVGSVGDANNEMFNQGFRFDSDTTLQITGLSGVYDIYLYFAARNSAGQDDDNGVTNGTTTYYWNQNGFTVYDSANSFTQITSTDSNNPSVGDHVVFSNQSDAIFAADLSLGGNDYALTGIQVVTIPEPSTGLLLSLGLGGVLLAGGRKRRA